MTITVVRNKKSKKHLWFFYASNNTITFDKYRCKELQGEEWVTTVICRRGADPLKFPLPPDVVEEAREKYISKIKIVLI